MHFYFYSCLLTLLPEQQQILLSVVNLVQTFVTTGITTTSQQPSARNEMRYQAIKQAVDEGLLPESALNQLDLYEDEDVNDEEIQSVQYNYSFVPYHFLLATQYVATLLTINVKQDDYGDFVPVGELILLVGLKL